MGSPFAQPTKCIVMRSAAHSVFKFASILCLIAFAISCEKKPTPAELHAESLTIIQRLIERDRTHPIHDEFKALRSKALTGSERTEALKRHQESCADFDRLRVTLQVGRALSDYTGIERLGNHVGSDPYRFFITGFGGYVSEQGPEPHSVKIDIDAKGVITKLGVIVAAQ
jgi:hypothetical protein